MVEIKLYDDKKKHFYISILNSSHSYKIHIRCKNIKSTTVVIVSLYALEH